MQKMAGCERCSPHNSLRFSVPSICICPAEPWHLAMTERCPQTASSEHICPSGPASDFLLGQGVSVRILSSHGSTLHQQSLFRPKSLPLVPPQQLPSVICPRLSVPGTAIRFDMHRATSSLIPHPHLGRSDASWPCCVCGVSSTDGSTPFPPTVYCLGSSFSSDRAVDHAPCKTTPQSTGPPPASFRHTNQETRQRQKKDAELGCKYRKLTQ